MTTRVYWLLVEMVSRLLDQPERDVVRGDLAECGARPGPALREVAGLVIRRQAALWIDWRPWLAVASVVIPIGLLLSHASRWWGIRGRSPAMVAAVVGDDVAGGLRARGCGEGAMAREQRARVNRPPSLLIVTGITLGALAVSLFAQSALDYPQWRGQVRDGSASGFVEPSSWPQALKQQWKVDVGEGYATPVVIGDIVYVFTRRDGQEVMAALDTASGKERWRSGYAAAYAPSPPTKVHGSGPKATPLYLDGKLFTQGITGIVSALDATSGKRLWQTREPAEHPFYSAASSPAGERGLMLVHPGNYEALTAYDVNDGTVKWITGDGGFFMSPLIVTIEGTRQAVTVTQSAVIGVSLPDGRLLWRYPWSGGGMGGSMPVAYGQTIVVSAGVGVTALKPTHRGSTWVAEMAWETKDVSTYVSNSVVIGDTLFGFSTRNSGQFFAIDARDGKVLWLGPPREAANSAVVKANNVIFFLNDDGELIVARSSRERFDIIARYTVSETATWAQPAISGNRIFIKDAGSIALWTID